MKQRPAYENGNGFSHVDGTLVILGVELPSCTNFEINTERPVTQNVGMSPQPVSWGYEAKTTSGSLEISQKDMNKLRGLSLTGSVLDIIPAPGHLLFDNSVGNKQITTWTSLKFTNDGVSTASGNTETMYSLNFVAVNVITKAL